MRIIFMGTPEFAVPVMEGLYNTGYDIEFVVTQPDRPKGRGGKLSWSPVKERAIELGLKVMQPLRVKDDDFINLLEEIKPDFIVVAAFGQILPERLLRIPHYGCINVHASLLPYYRGAAPIQRAVMNGEKKTGVTIMLMDKGLDTGDMLAKEEVEIALNDTFGLLHDSLAQVGVESLLKTLPLWIEGKVEPVSQVGMKSSYAYPLKREDELICWDSTARNICNQIRALNPWPGAFTLFQGNNFKIMEAETYDMKQTNMPGAVLALIKGKGFVVQTGEGSILVKMVKPMGKNIMSAQSFINGYHVEVGYVFGAGK
ncbi:MAG: methionyl-tRNA formyltransferase [Clostridia bacterium]|nr:methionyl-tRNA formyltransferase [Clostridia bacterium]MDD4048495.1 methionyl-tRNA formyltransferase [Clostridia bacterium]